MVNLSLKFIVNPIVFLQDIAANKNTWMLIELLMEVTQMARDIQFIKAEIAKSRRILVLKLPAPESFWCWTWIREG